ncbi:reverse transcriptase domain-containing protein [Tanacetum coccineum]|uniref:Reverse transcriptase domain-containing protein n=1 Tax=Tanacetum coccineum TaxID=301880 RepID=A0ABQ5CF22_9ASTR
MTQDVHDNNVNVLPKEPLVVELKKPVGLNDVLANDQPQMTSEHVQPSNEQLHINLPFIESLAQMPKYAKFLKGLLTNKARLEEACNITMNERCSAILLNKLPSKEKDPRSFTIPYDISQVHIDNALADLGASISLIPYTMYKKLGLGEPKDTRMILELADRSILPERNNKKRRPFLATARAMIDIFNKKITLKVGDNEVIFDVDQSIKRPTTEDDEYLECYESTSSNENDGSDLENSIRCIDYANTPYPVTQGTKKRNDVKSEHLYSVSADEIDEKKPELKNLPQHLQYAYLHGDKSFPNIILSKLSEKEKNSLLQVLERQKGKLLGKCQTSRESVRHSDYSKYQSLQRIKKRLPSPVLMGGLFDIEIKDKKGAEIIAADHLSRLENPDLGTFTEEEITNEFPNEHLMILKAELNNDEPWYDDYVNYIVGKIVPQNWDT